ncbi:hypothetical protein A3K78_11170 [Candidatus Bathyarchaeota archaeon RBG_13_52_12]|nr:MAG: hypothetical protein A3K78_11170 [Candidatus Bathyarchaeota archaeon RBG_13_52_12]
MGESQARTPIRIKIAEVGEAPGELNRLTAPLTVGDILKMLPINGRTVPAHGCVSIILGLKRGAEKPVTQVDAGTIAYWPRTGSLCIYPEATRTYGPVNKIGRVTGNLEIFKNLKSGSRIIVVPV